VFLLLLAERERVERKMIDLTGKPLAAVQPKMLIKLGKVFVRNYKHTSPVCKSMDYAFLFVAD